MNPHFATQIPPPIPLPDAEERRAIREELGVTMLVEAAAGTGKTTCMTDRMAALLAGGHCASVDRLAAVTFTRKAAAELRGRFQGALEKAAADVQGAARERLTEALEHVESCFIGTIHSFCARLLRERPVEAGVGVEFLEADEEDDQQMRLDAWEQTIAELYAGGGAALEAFNERRLDPALLREAFLRYCEYTDVEEWPAPAVAAPPLDEALTALQEYAAHIQQMEPRLPKDAGNDNLIPRYREIPRRIAQANLAAPADVAEIMERFDTSAKVIQRAWGAGAEGKEQAKAEQARWDDFRARIAGPFLERWREFRYETIMSLFQRGRKIYGDMREHAGMLNYQDLLTRATALLKDKPHVREYFRKRYTHLLVDEFQDTDPVQAQAMLLLTADDPSQPDWRRCRPAPGSLFVVGDPKQSIYRFRRADIVTYNQVKDIIRASGGRIVPLWANFRSTKGILDWVNGVFGDPEMFPQEADEYSPRYVALQSGRAPDDEPEAAPVIRLQAPEDLKNQDAVAEWEAGAIARIIEAQIREGRRPGDFMIVTMTMSRLAVYGRMLEERGIPHEVTGGSALNEAPQVALLRDCLKALAEPDNPVALVAVLRGVMFGISDPALYHFKRQGGEFCFHAPIPDGLPADEAALLRGAFERLRRHAEWLIRLPPAPAIERIAEDLGLAALAAAGPGGTVRSGSLAKAIELIREQQDRIWSLAELVQR
ncbi:MAG: UvrD-helicase domain-containing protein, partial [Candidatus Sumerlaeota bacterium]|nr:UvrD-helicase domain-containing protein [Candidatus Sumerlaeota bacterium]